MLFKHFWHFRASLALLLLTKYLEKACYITALAHPQMTSVVVYPALFMFVFQLTCSGSRWSQIHGSWFSPDKVLQNALGKIFPSFQFLVKPAAAAAAMDVTAIDAATVVDKDQ